MMKMGLIELEKDPIRNYEALNSIYADMLENDPQSLEKYGFRYLMKFSALSAHYIEMNKEYLAKENDPIKLRWHLNRILQFSLFSNNLVEYNKALKENANKVAPTSLIEQDFRYIDNLVTIEDNDCLTFLADEQLNPAVCRVLIEGISEVVRQKFERSFPKPKVFLMRGRGPSPFNSDLNCAFMMIGHYQGTSFEREIFQTSITHELTHLDLRKSLRLPVDMNNAKAFKFFDEGLAVQNSYATLANSENYYIKFKNTACLIRKYTDYSTRDIIENWGIPIKGISPIQTYDYACALVNFLDFKFAPLTSMGFFIAWISQTEVKSLYDFFETYYKTTFEEVDNAWSVSLDDFDDNTVFTTKTEIDFDDIKSERIEFSYVSEHELWPEQNLFCQSETGKLLTLKSNDINQYRFQKHGKFMILFDDTDTFKVENITFTVLFQNCVEHITPNIK